MKRPLAALALGMAWLAACRAAGPPPSLADFIGRWLVTRINNYATITTGEAGISALLGSALDIGNGKIIEAGAVACSLNPKTDTLAMVRTSKEMPPQDGITAEAAGLPPTAEKLETSCMDSIRPVTSSSSATEARTTRRADYPNSFLRCRPYPRPTALSTPCAPRPGGDV